MIRGTLLTEGSSDKVLLHILKWLLGTLTATPIDLTWADLRVLRPPPSGLANKVRWAIDLYPGDLLFVHRDRDRATVGEREQEILCACEASAIEPPVVVVIPVRMQEAWLLIDEAAIRQAAGKPTGRVQLNIPRLTDIEGIANPKETLHQALRDASELRGRRAKRFNPRHKAYRLAEIIDDWSSLRLLPAFQKLEQDTLASLDALGIQTY